MTSFQRQLTPLLVNYLLLRLSEKQASHFGDWRQGSTLFETRSKGTRERLLNATLIGQHKICATFQYKHVCRAADNAYTDKLWYESNLTIYLSVAEKAGCGISSCLSVALWKCYSYKVLCPLTKAHSETPYFMHLFTEISPIGLVLSTSSIESAKCLSNKTVEVA